MSDYPSFPKIPRLHREVVITEKIDGTNGLIYVESVPPQHGPTMDDWLTCVPVDSEVCYIYAGSRNRWLSIKDDNHGFAYWVEAHAEELVRGLGPGHHYGEWWGSGIGRGYGLTNGEKRFSLFNVTRWGESGIRPACCQVVPVVATGDGSRLNIYVESALMELSLDGSVAAPGYDNPEGVVIYHTAANVLFKVTLLADNKPAAVKVAKPPIVGSQYVGGHISDVPPWTWPATRMAPFAAELVTTG